MQYFEKQSEQTLLRFLDHLNASDAVLNYPQIQGLLYAMACSPEPIKPAEWFELIWLNDDPQFENATEAKRFYELLNELFASISFDVQHNRFKLFSPACPEQAVPALVDWCDGFLMGHRYLEDVWDAALDELDDDDLFEQVAATLDCASSFIFGDVAVEDDEFLLTELVNFQQLLCDYCAIHTRCRERRSAWCIEHAFLEMEPVARTDACFCGSGRAFEHCCLH